MAGEASGGKLSTIIKENGGIAPYSKTTAGGLKEEYREDVPLHLRNSKGLKLDEMADVLKRNYPQLGIESESDLLKELRDERLAVMAGMVDISKTPILNEVADVIESAFKTQQEIKKGD